MTEGPTACATRQNYPRQDSNIPVVSKVKQQIPPERGTESGTLNTDSADKTPWADSDLAAVGNVWPDLPATIKAGILAMVKASKAE